MISFKLQEPSAIIIGQFFLQNEPYSLLDWIIMLTGPGLVLFFTFYLMWSGKRKNHKIMFTTRDALLEIFSNEFEDLITDKLSSNGGLLFPKYKKTQLPFKDFRVVFALEERHIMLSVIISKFSGVNDYIALEANARKGNLSTKIQIIPTHEEGQIKKHQDLLFTLSNLSLNVEKLDSYFVMKASAKRAGLFYLGDRSLLKQLHSVRKSIVRISINSDDDPSVRVYARIDENLDLGKLSNFFVAMCERVNEVHDKRVMKRN